MPHYTRRQFARKAATLAAASVVAGFPSLLRGTRGQEIVHWDVFPPDTEMGRLLRRHAAAFEAQTGIRVKLTFTPFNTFHDKQMTLILARRLPDVVWTYDATTAEAVALGGIRDLRPLLNAEPPDMLDDFIRDPIEAITWNEQTWGLPWATSTEGMLWNKGLFRNAGLVDEKSEPVPPASWAHVLTAAQKLTAGHVHGIGMGCIPRKTGIWYWTSWLLQNGAWYVNDDLTAAFASEQAIEAYSFACDLYLRHGVMPNPNSLDFPELTQLFASGNLGMAYLNAGAIVDIEKSKGPGMEYDCFAPGPRRVSHGGHRGPQWWSISRFSKHPEAAWAWIKHLCSPEVMRDSMLLGGNVCLRKSVLTDPDLRAQLSGPMVGFADLSLLPTTRALPLMKHTAKMMDMIATACQQIILRRRSPHRALTEMAEKWDAHVRRHPQR